MPIVVNGTLPRRDELTWEWLISARRIYLRPEFEPKHRFLVAKCEKTRREKIR